MGNKIILIVSMIGFFVITSTLIKPIKIVNEKNNNTLTSSNTFVYTSSEINAIPITVYGQLLPSYLKMVGNVGQVELELGDTTYNILEFLNSDIGVKYLETINNETLYAVEITDNVLKIM
jgi:hypothetical protein